MVNGVLNDCYFLAVYPIPPGLLNEALYIGENIRCIY